MNRVPVGEVVSEGAESIGKGFAALFKETTYKNWATGLYRSYQKNPRSMFWGCVGILVTGGYLSVVDSQVFEKREEKTHMMNLPLPHKEETPGEGGEAHH